jgi:hypothetical protein
MKPEDQIKALAKLDGWKQHIVTVQSEHDYEEFRWHSTTDEREDSRNLPSYLTSYDAIIPLIQKQSLLVKVRLVKLLDLGIVDGWYDYLVVRILDSTPTQLAEALLRATRLWEKQQ